MSTELEKDLACIEAATEGPWEHDGDSELGQFGDVTIWANGEAVATQVVDNGADGYICNMDNDLTPHANAEFIARSRTRWPLALAVVKAAMEWRRSHDDYHDLTPEDEALYAYLDAFERNEVPE
jgi:hypothetical protein